MSIKGIYKYFGVFMLIGLSLMITGFAMGGAKYGMYLDLSGVHISGKGTNINISENDLERFSKINIDANLSNVEFVSSDQYGIEINYSSGTGTPTWSIKDGLLKISDGYIPINSVRLFNMDFGVFNFGEDSQNYIKVYLPADVTLDDVTVTLSCGNAVVGNFNAVNTKITNHLGNVKLNKVTSENLIASLNAGDIELSNSEIKELDVKNNLGNIVITNSVVTNSEISLDAGDARMSGDFSGRTNINTSFGDIKVNLSRAKEYYNINLSTSLGDIKVDNYRVGNNATILDGNNENLLKIKNSCGDIEVNFNR